MSSLLPPVFASATNHCRASNWCPYTLSCACGDKVPPGVRQVVDNSRTFFSSSLPLTWRAPQVPGNLLRQTAASFCIPVLTLRFYVHSPTFSSFSWKLTFWAGTPHSLSLICKALFQIHVLLFEVFCSRWSAFWVSGLRHIQLPVPL